MLVSLVGIANAMKGIVAMSGAFDQMVLLLDITVWLIWILNEVFKNWSLPAPFAYSERTN